jgi:hypothetical protein
MDKQERAVKLSGGTYRGGSVRLCPTVPITSEIVVENSQRKKKNRRAHPGPASPTPELSGSDERSGAGMKIEYD